MRGATRAEMERRLREDPPEQGQPFTDVLAQVAKDVVPFGMRADHPRNLAYVPSSGTWPGALADFIASAANLNPIFWRFSPGASEAEALVIDWFKDWIGYPARGRRRAGQRRLGRQPDGAGVRARVAGRRDVWTRRRVRLRPGALVARARRARARLPPRSGARPAGRRALHAAPRRISTPRWTPTSAPAAVPLFVAAAAGIDEHRRRRPAARDRRDLPRRTARGSTSTAPTAGSRRSPSAGSGAARASSSPTR